MENIKKISNKSVANDIRASKNLFDIVNNPKKTKTKTNIKRVIYLNLVVIYQRIIKF